MGLDSNGRHTQPPKSQHSSSHLLTSQTRLTGLLQCYRTPGPFTISPTSQTSVLSQMFLAGV